MSLLREGRLTVRDILDVPVSPHDTPAARWSRFLSAALVPVAAVTSAITLVRPSVLHGPAAMNGSARGTALVILVLALPAVVIGMRLDRRLDSPRGRVLWLGGLAYLTYNAVLFCFATPFNSLFPGYVAMLGLAFWALLTTFSAAARRTGWRGSGTRPAAFYLATVVVLNTAAWMVQIVPGLVQRPPAFLADTGLTTNPVFVQDLAIWLPAMTVTAVMLWTDHRWSLLVGGAGLIFWQIEALGVAVDQWFGHHADPTSSVASLGAVYLFVALFAVGSLPTWSVVEKVPSHRTVGPARVPERP